MAADPFSIFATVSGLVALAASLSKQVYSVAADVKHAPEGIDSLSKEVESMSLVLNRLETSLKDDFDKKYPFSLGSAEDLRPVLKNCERVFKGLNSKLEKYKKENILDRIKFVFSDKDFAKLQRALEAHKQTLSITLILLTEEAAKEIQRTTQVIHQTTSDTHDNVQDNQKVTAEIKELVLELIKNLKPQEGNCQLPTEKTGEVITRYLKRTETLVITNALTEEALVETTTSPSLPESLTEVEIESPQAYISDDTEDEESGNQPPDEPKQPQNHSSNELIPPQHPSPNEPITQDSDQKPEGGIPEVKNRDGSPKSDRLLDKGKELVESMDHHNLNNSSPVNTTPKKAVSPAVAKRSAQALMTAAANGNMKMVLLLADMVTDFNMLSGQDEITALQVAIRNGHMDVVRELLSRGADPNVSGWYHPAPLTMAIQQDNTELTNLLLEKGANANASAGTSGQWVGCALNIAIASGKDDVAMLLLSRGADPNLQGHMNALFPIQTAVKNKNMRAVEYLIEHEANLNNRNIMTGTALIMAVEANDEVLMNLLLDKGADIHAAGDRSQGTPLNMALRFDNNHLAKLLLDRGANPNVQGDMNALFPLQTAVYRNNKEAVEFLLEKGARTDLRMILEPLPIDIAVKNGNDEIMMILMEHESH